jgi:hypothetical protein
LRGASSSDAIEGARPKRRKRLQRNG